MMDDNEKRATTAKASRDQRLKSALRENLRRRKLQARERAEGGEASHDEGSPGRGTAGEAGT